jgi:hypothetical protein
MTCGAQLSWRHRRGSAGGVVACRSRHRPARARERGEGGLAPDPAGVAALDEQLRGADGSNATLLEQLGRQLGEERGECALGDGDLLRESLDTVAEPTQNALITSARGRRRAAA